MSYASGTDVTINRSIQELERLVAKHGATGFGYGRDDTEGYAQVAFRIADRMIRFRIAQADWHDYRLTTTGRSRAEAAAMQFAADEDRRRWRSLVLVVKALLVAVADGVVSLSDAFLPYTLLPSGGTFGEWAEPQLDVIAATRTMPSLLPGAAPEHRALEARASTVNPNKTPNA